MSKIDESDKKITYVLRKVEDVKKVKAKQRCKICDFGHNGTCHHPRGCKEGYAWKREPKPVVDEQKKWFAEAVISSGISYRTGGYFDCCHCNALGPDSKSVTHESYCIITEAKQYLEGLEDE